MWQSLDDWHSTVNLETYSMKPSVITLFVACVMNPLSEYFQLELIDLTLARVMTITQSMKRAQKESRDIQSQHRSNVTLSREGAYTLWYQKKKCYKRLGTDHTPADCHFKSSKCNKCHKTAHSAKACQTIQSEKHSKAKTGMQKCLRRRKPYTQT